MLFKKYLERKENLEIKNKILEIKNSIEKLKDNLEESFQKWGKNGKQEMKDKKNKGYVQVVQPLYDRGSKKRELRKQRRENHQ